jgi:hypothetical protein
VRDDGPRNTQPCGVTHVVLHARVEAPDADGEQCLTVGFGFPAVVVVDRHRHGAERRLATGVARHDG